MHQRDLFCISIETVAPKYTGDVVTATLQVLHHLGNLLRRLSVRVRGQKTDAGVRKVSPEVSLNGLVFRTVLLKATVTCKDRLQTFRRSRMDNWLHNISWQTLIALFAEIPKEIPLERRFAGFVVADKYVGPVDLPPRN